MRVVPPGAIGPISPGIRQIYVYPIYDMNAPAGTGTPVTPIFRESPSFKPVGVIL